MANLQVAFNGVLGVGVIGALVLAGLAFTKSGGIGAFGGSGGDSPVRILGGSISVRSKGAAWSCLSCTVSGTSNIYTSGTYQSGTVNPSELALEGVLAAQGNTDAPYAWTNMVSNWKIVIHDRNSSGANGIQVCSTRDCAASGTLASTNIYVELLSANSAFYTVPAPNDNGNDYGVRFADKDTAGCTAASSDQDLCEHMGKIDVTINSVTKSYSCPTAACRIFIGK